MEHRGFLGQCSYSIYYCNSGCIIHLSKPIEFMPKVNPKVNYGLSVMMMYQCRLINVTNVTLMQDIDGEGGTGVWAASIWEISVLPAQLCCELKTSLKNKVY